MTALTKWQQNLVLLAVLCLLPTSALNSERYGNFRSCGDILKASQQQGQPTPTNGEYILTLPPHGAVSIYCAGFDGGSPREYLTLVSGRSTNFAEIYSRQGERDKCQEKDPTEFYTGGGRSEFYRLRIHLPQLTVELGDPTFAFNFDLPIGYGTAGDLYSRTPDCGPLGQFSVDLRGTPFSVAPNVSWHWDGHFADGSTNGKAFIHNTNYIGCFEDSGDRLFPTRKLTSGSDAQHVTPDTCSQACSAAGFRYAGIEYSRECFCGDSYGKHRRAVESQCNMRCAGDHSRFCGGTWRISVYDTVQGQVITGRCGGYPASCYPVIGSQLSSPAMLLMLSSQQPCLLDPCQQNELCVSLTSESFKCIPACNTTWCDISPHPVVSTTADCPMGLMAVQCACASNTCTGARFSHDKCQVSTGQPQVTCVNGDPGTMQLTDVQGRGLVHCPYGSAVVGCSYWDSARHHQGNGLGTVVTQNKTCSVSGCTTCTVYARCQSYVCGCENGATCNPITGQCLCAPGYYGSQCQLFDYCGYYEDHNDDHAPACSAGTCQAVPASDIRTYGVGQTDSCVFPFTVDTSIYSRSPLSAVTYTECVDDNLVGPPFACGTYFDGVDDYVDMGTWSPGAVYTLATWVSPSVNDTRRRVILGAGRNCRDFGLITKYGKFMALYSPVSQGCTADLQGPPYEVNKWYLVAVTNNGTHASLYVGNVLQAQTAVRPYFLPTSEAFSIGSTKTTTSQNFKGYIKSVKVWKRSLDVDEIQSSMTPDGIYNSSSPALQQGLVAYYELGETVNVSCQGVDHAGDDWTLTQDQEVSGIHCNVNRLTIGRGITATVAPYDGVKGGTFEVYAQDIYIHGYLTAAGSGYRGGQSPTGAGADGSPGESYHTPNASSGHININAQFYQAHRGGGGGGGGTHQSNGNAGPGGGGGYGSNGGTAQRTGYNHKGQGGQAYGSTSLEQLYLGSGGGSGGNAADLRVNPEGGRGGNGGGAIGLYAKGAVQIDGHVSVAGENGQGDIGQASGCNVCPSACQGSSPNNCHGSSSSACWDSSGPGGGGSGGSLYIRGDVVDVGWDNLWMEGGAGGLGGAGGCGGDGSVGRLRVDAVILRGQPPANTQVNIYNSTTLYEDLSFPGQKLIQYNSQLVYGNEVFRGCFQDSGNRHFGFTLPVTSTSKQSMTPAYCMQQCRQNGYAFSAVEYGYECYCDNAFKSNLLRPESECNMPCNGDRGQVCGGSYRMSVYGPRSFLPAKAVNGALQQCRPWCLTGNLYSAEPSWGYCDLSSQTSVSYNIRCQCPAGFQGINCDQPCPQGMWGLNCLKVCICNKTNSIGCDPEDGTCNCRPGFEGDTCDLKCSPGYFGQKCAGRCTCPDTADCDFVTGQCTCKPGWKGVHCNFPCPAGTYGNNCSGSCQCYQGSCSPGDGTCSCDPGYKLPNCFEKCEETNYGPNCMQVCGCHGQPCDPFTGICRCNPGFQGSRCEKICPHGKYGKNCQQVCQCQNNAGCDHVDGECDCPAGWTGWHCGIACSSYQYGADCGDQCTCVQANSEGCDGVTGVCTCKPGFTGDRCQLPCPMGYYGANCVSRCNCYNNAPCDKRTGQCQCGAGFTGDQCQSPCPDGHYGQNCSSTCPTCSTGVCSKNNGTCICGSSGSCQCSTGFKGAQCQQVCQCMHGTCDQSGQCDCDSGWQGTQCDTPCPAGSYGKYCLSRCQCEHGNCSAEDGTCTCLPGYQGTLCDTKCTAGSFGVNCSGVCEPCGPGAVQDSCDPVSGNCVCRPGYTGLQCDRPCPENTYGDGCSQPCSCINGACNNVDGTCECSPGYMGQHCTFQCATGLWGLNCMNECSCKGHWLTCDSSTGLCQCNPGFTGDQCDQTCSSGTWGQDCANQCTCDKDAAECSPIDGSCQCRPGYHGPSCDECPVNTYGVNCSQVCDCSDHGSCDNMGNCDCDPGYQGDKCQTQCEQDEKWGKDCRMTCDCSDQHCDFVDGLCRCDPGKQGRHCDQTCDKDHFGFQCAQLCQCRNGATCDPVTGQCHCPPGLDGTTCSRPCPMGRYGPGCSLICPCASNMACDGNTGVCQCPPGLTGPTCTTPCPIGTYGVSCSLTCDCSGHGRCNNMGDCLCDAGYQGAICQMPCTSNTYGVNCSLTCDCSGHGNCDNMGTCHCNGGYQGAKCETAGSSNPHGTDHTPTCDCSGHGRCDGTGTCQCYTGYHGVRCQTSCSTDPNGVGCSHTCDCSGHGNCDNTGTCHCDAGYQGTRCEQSCASGWWGVNCAMKCSVNCTAGCHTDTGHCKCTAQSCPSGFICQPTGLCGRAGAFKSSDSGLSGGQISGVVIGVILAVVLVGLVVFILLQRRNIAGVERLLNRFKSESNGASSTVPEVQGEDNPIYFAKTEPEEATNISIEMKNMESES